MLHAHWGEPVLVGEVEYRQFTRGQTGEGIVNTSTGVDDTAMNALWGMYTADAANRTATTFTVSAPGVHTLNFWLVDPTVVVQKLVVDTGGLADSYLGPPESYRGRR
jgi:hypothetical protein